MVFSWVDDLAGAVNLCLVDGRFFELDHETVVRLQRRAPDSLAGDRIIFLGDYCRDEDMPESMREIIDRDCKERWSDANMEQQSVCDLINRYYLYISNGKDFNHSPDRFRLRQDYEPFCELVEAKRDGVLRDPHALCNLTKKVYVCTQALDALKLEARGRIGLHQALLCRVC
jgi:hypothetical protein